MLVLVLFSNVMPLSELYLCFFFNDTATTEIYTRSLSAASDVYKRQDLEHVPDMMEALVWEAAKEQPDLLIVSGDLTFNLSLIHISEPTRPY